VVNNIHSEIDLRGVFLSLSLGKVFGVWRPLGESPFLFGQRLGEDTHRW